MASIAQSRTVLDCFTRRQVDRIAREIADDGIACLEHVFSDEEIAHARSQAARAVEEKGGEYTARTGPDGMDGTILAALSSSATFVQLCRNLCLRMGIPVSPNQSTKQVLRCLAGNTGLNHAYYFHFDSFELTALVPITIPEDGRTGDLLLLPNFRARRGSYLLNALEKFVLDRPPVQAMLKRHALRSPLVRRVRLHPGNIYFFNGNRTLHANEECDPQSLRATLVLHYAETYHDHWLRRVRRSLRAPAGSGGQVSSSMRSG